MVSFWISSELKEEGLEERTSILSNIVEVRVVVSDIGIPIFEGAVDDVGVGDLGILGVGLVEAVGFLGGGGVLVVVPGEGVEGTELVPSGAEVGGGIAVEAADVAAGEWEAEELVAVHAVDGVAHVVDGGPVVAHPVIPILSKSREVRSTQHIRSLALIDQILSSRLHLHQRISAMHIIFSPSIGMQSIHSQSLIFQVSPAWHIVGLVPQ